jgi:hypothetical protein
MYCINTSSERKLMPFVGITVTEIMMEMEEKEETVFAKTELSEATQK